MPGSSSSLGINAITSLPWPGFEPNLGEWLDRQTTFKKYSWFAFYSLTNHYANSFHWLGLDQTRVTLKITIYGLILWVSSELSPGILHVIICDLTRLLTPPLGVHLQFIKFLTRACLPLDIRTQRLASFAKVESVPRFAKFGLNPISSLRRRSL